MKVAILAGGLGLRLAPETTFVPKPMIEIGGHPILWQCRVMPTTDPHMPNRKSD